MSKIDVLSLKGEKVGVIDLPAAIFEAKINPPLMAQAVRVYLSNQRQGNAKAKTRAEVIGSTAKIWRQKGTGRARHGSRKAPIFVGGGVAHGPTGKQNYHLKLSQGMKRAALFSALSLKLKNNQITVVDGLEDLKPKTKNLLTVLNALHLVSAKSKLKATLLYSEKPESLLRAGHNLAGLVLLRVNDINTYQILNGGQLLFLKSSLTRLEAVYHKQTTPSSKTTLVKKTQSKPKKS